MTIQDNPLGTDGFEFLEFSSPNPEVLVQQFHDLGFAHIATHRSKVVDLYRQGTINFILNKEPASAAMSFAKEHGPGCCAMGFRVADPAHALEKTVAEGATPYVSPIGEGELAIPAIFGVGGSLIYFVAADSDQALYTQDFVLVDHVRSGANEAGLTYIDHVTHNLKAGQMAIWRSFYERMFNFKEVRYFDIRGEHTGLTSHAMASPCGKIRIPLNEPTEAQSQIAEFIEEFNGEGIQHIALGTDNIYESIEKLRDQAIDFLTIPDTYYELLSQRLPDHGEDLARMQKNRILIDGGEAQGGGLLLQIFTETMLGPVFFEIIQRKGNDGFGEGNFKALFQSMELDQIRRGVLDPNDKS